MRVYYNAYIDSGSFLWVCLVTQSCSDVCKIQYSYRIWTLLMGKFVYPESPQMCVKYDASVESGPFLWVSLPHIQMYVKYNAYIESGRFLWVCLLTHAALHYALLRSSCVWTYSSSSKQMLKLCAPLPCKYFVMRGICARLFALVAWLVELCARLCAAFPCE